MPNGKGFPQCGECVNFQKGDKPCKIHDFLFPYIGYEILCRDYQPMHGPDNIHGPDKRLANIKELTKGCLFYYSYASGIPYQNLDAFKELQSLVYGVHVMKHNDKWILKIEDWQPDLKDAKSIFLKYGDKKGEFEQKKIVIQAKLPHMSKKDKDNILSLISDEEKGPAKEMFDTVFKGGVRDENINCFVPKEENSNLLESFLNEFIDLKKYYKLKKEWESIHDTVPLDINIFIKNIKPGTYELKSNPYFKVFLKDIDENKRWKRPFGSLFRKLKD